MEPKEPKEETIESPRTVDRPRARVKDSIRITAQPHSEVEPYHVVLPKEDRRNIGYDLMQQIRQAISDMGEMNCNYDLYESLYEMHVEPRTGPQGQFSSNVFIPLIPEMIDTMTARLASVIFQPRFFIVNGNTEQGVNVASKIERAFNAWLTQLGWVDPLFTWLQQSLLYGNGIMGVFWKRKIVKRKRYVDVPRVDPDTGLPAINLDTGEQIVDRKLTTEPVTEYDDVELVPIPAKEFVVFPVWARSIDSALGVARKVRLSEQELQAMVREGTLWKEAVEQALSYVPEGENERPTDIEGDQEVSADNQININQGSINESPYRRQRGPLEIWQVHTGQYDFDNDGEFEENILWVHEMSQELLGHDEYAYWHGHRPYVAGIPMPRDQIFPGFSVGDRLRTIQAEVNTKENQKNDAIDRAISPTLVYTRGTECKTQANRIGPGAEWEVEGQVGTSISFLQYPDVPLSTWEEVEWLYQRAMTIMGLNAPMMGAQSAGRRTRGEVMLQAQSAGVRLDLIANRMRQAMKEIAWQVLQLKIQYGPDEKEVKDYTQTGLPEKLVVSKQDLSQDIDVDIAGNGGPLDRTGRQQDTMVLYSLLMQNPLVQAKMVHVYAVTRMMLDDHNRSDVPALIGTIDDAAKLDKARQQQQRMAMMMQLSQAQQGQTAVHAPPRSHHGQHPQPGGVPMGMV
jgi:hypothetical protein